jgi:integrase
MAKKQAGLTFGALGRRWLATKKPGWVQRYHDRVSSRFQQDIFPRIGHLPITEIEPPLLLKHIRAIEARGAIESARRLNGQCGEIFRFGIAEGICVCDPSADIRDALASKPRVEHQQSMKERDLSKFLRLLVDDNELVQDTKDAMLLTILTASRTEEIRFMDFSEFEDMDGDEPLWRIPPERMKKSRPHLVPLSRQAAEIVNRRLIAKPKGLLFAHSTRSGTISENTMLFGLYRLGYKGKATIHGFRSTFSTIANENNWNSDWIEMALAHAPGNTIRSTYNAAKYLPQRRDLLQWWADFLDEQRNKATGKCN